MSTYKAAQDLTVDILHEMVDYDPVTGFFTWRANRPRRRGQKGVAGARAGYVADGYRAIWLEGRPYQEHRLVWLYLYGRWPQPLVDHINLDGTDNRLANLREATDSQNLCNRGKQRNNKSGYKGVSWSSRAEQWTARIKAFGVYRFLGYFADPEDAAAAYKAAAYALHGEFARVE